MRPEDGFVISRGAHTKIRLTSSVGTRKYCRSTPLKEEKSDVKISNKGRAEKDASRDAWHFMKHENRMANTSNVKVTGLINC